MTTQTTKPPAELTDAALSQIESLCRRYPRVSWKAIARMAILLWSRARAGGGG